MALGADGLAIIRLIVLQGLKPALAGIVVGLLAGSVANGWIRTQLYEVSPGDTAVAATVAVLLIAITLLACIIPAWRASRIDPSSALRSE